MFDIDKCKEDNWDCEVLFSDEEYKKAVFDGYDRYGNPRVLYKSDEIIIDNTKIRNLQKLKIKRWTESCKIASLSNDKNNKFISVPMIIIDDKHPVVDHSDAILEVLNRIIKQPSHTWVFADIEIKRIKKERGE
jgi:hypothetical protein